MTQREELTVDEPGRLLDFLRASLTGWKRKTLEQRVREGCVEVNGAVVVRPHHVLGAGDRVCVGAAGTGVPPLAAPEGCTILHHDEWLVAIDKPAGLLSVPLDGRRGRSALGLVRDALSRPGRPARLWPVHRLDREASGVLLFARTSEARDALQESWTQAHKLYLALVEGRPIPPHGVIETPLWEDAGLNVHAGKHADAKSARTRYRTLENVGERSLLEVELDTGRRHQIRVHLASIGHPIVGDPRYGTRAGRMGLHAQRLRVEHPGRSEPIQFEAPVPAALRALLGRAAR
ncbi:MAG: RluA family pseudouridine synthase [Planctomycetes bacterium]|nr:RluA family pseudouridine synthase [Planctomycetota bacterium]